MKSNNTAPEDLDLMPVMNLFSILIPFLLSVAVFQKIAIVDVDMPMRDKGSFIEIPDPIENQLGMSVFITETAIKLWAWDRPFFEADISWREGENERIPTLVHEGNTVDAIPVLGEKLTEINNRGADMQDANNATLIAESDVKTQAVIQLMDVLKESGFSALNLARLGAP